MSIKSFLQEIEKGLPSRIYLLYSDDQYLLEDAALSIKKTIPDSEMHFSFNIYDLDSPDALPTPEQIIGTLNTSSFFSGKRYVIVKNFQKISSKDLKQFRAYFENPSPDSVVVILYNGTLKKEHKENMKEAKGICLDIKGNEIFSWVKEKVRQKGLTIKDDAVEYLIGITGGEIGILSSETEKLSLLGNEVITIQGIKEIVEGSRDYSVFDLTRALREKDVEQVFRIYRVLAETLEPYNLLGAINWQYSRMSVQVKDATSENYFQKVFELLNTADIAIKSSGGTYPIEYLLVKLLQL